MGKIWQQQCPEFFPSSSFCVAPDANLRPAMSVGNNSQDKSDSEGDESSSSSSSSSAEDQEGEAVLAELLSEEIGASEDPSSGAQSSPSKLAMAQKMLQKAVGGGKDASAKPRDNGTNSSSEQKSVSAEVLRRWDHDLAMIREAIGFMLCNKLDEADHTLEALNSEVADREIDFEGGEHDLRGAVCFVGGLMKFLNGVTSMENDQFPAVLKRLETTDEMLALDREWAGKSVIQGLNLVFGGIVQIMSNQLAMGVLRVLRSWPYLSTLETEGLNCVGHERECVRSTALFALGVFNLITSMLPPTIMRMAGWATGFKGGRQTALDQFFQCWQERGLQAPFAGLVYIGYAVDISSFLGESKADRLVHFAKAKQILDWAAKTYPGSFFFEASEATFIAASKSDLSTALERLDVLTPTVLHLPAFLFMVNIRKATFLCCCMRWSEAAKAWLAALEVERNVGRRTACPALASNAYLCHLAAGETEEAWASVTLCASYKDSDKKWNKLDAASLDLCKAIEKAESIDGVDGDPWWNHRRPRIFSS